jgi:hypothetical protein
MNYLRLILVALVMTACAFDKTKASSPIKVEIVSTDAGYQLMRGGKPYVIKGAGMGIDDIENFAAHGGNSIRNWTTRADDQSTLDLLDSASAHGVTVALCLSVHAERWGFDYDDANAVAAQLEAFREEVIRYRDHPAVLVWIIGNELNHGYSNARVYDAVNDIAGMINELDPNHPTTTTIEGVKPDVINDVLSRAPKLDFISFQVYGELFALPERVKAANYQRPYMVTEWGAIGYWEMAATSWGAPTEMTSSEKAAVFLRGQQEILAPLKNQMIGSYAFLWGQKQERTPTWFGMFTESGEATEVVDVMHYAWNGSWPGNRAPQVRAITLDGEVASSSVTLNSGQQVEAMVDVVDPDGDDLTYRWELKPESDATAVGGDHENTLVNIEHSIERADAATTMLTAPAPGAYRLFVYAFDGHGHAAHANIPFLVEK